jgi:hypothetical protein
MKNIFSSFTIPAIVLGLLLHAGAAEAQSARTWVSGAGDDTNDCSRAFPCRTFGQAYSVTSAGGEIDVLNGGDFGSLFINHAITVANDGAGTAGIIVTGFSASITAGAADAVVLRGLSLNGLNTSSSAVYFGSGGSLLIDHCEIQGFQSSAGILFVPSNSAKLWVKDTVLSNVGVSDEASVWIVGSGVTIATLTAHLERVQILHAIGNGIRIDGSSSAGGALDVELHDVTIDGGSSSGIVALSATSGGPAVAIMADEVTSSHNNGFGLRAVGGTASIALSRSTVTNNGRGIGASGGGALVSYGDNRIKDNINGDGDPTSTLPLK